MIFSFPVFILIIDFFTLMWFYDYINTKIGLICDD
jgi:hypothetical protein